MKRLLIILALLIAVSGAGILYLIYSIRLPDLNNPRERKVAQSTKIYDRTGKILLYDIHGEEKRTIIPFSEIPRNVKNASIALEDDTFYQHYGIRPLSILRALISDTITRGSTQGGSTITQQLVKNVFLTPQKTIWRKIKELILAIKVEHQYSKDKILNLYLNQIPYGNGAYGIEAAVETFFGKEAKDLTLRESAYLAALPRATSFYSPYGKNKDKLEERVQFALSKMKDLGFITDEEYKNAQEEKVVFVPNRAQGIIAPHFVLEVREQLNKMFGEDVVAEGGIKVTTTLDADLEAKAEEIIKKYADTNEKNFNATNEALVMIDPKTGDVLSMIGSRDYFDTKIDGNFNVATAHRQPGSALKPFVYATAFKKGYTPNTILFDVPTEFNPLCTPDGKPTNGGDENKCYHPQNFDEKFRGPITMRESLAQSLNVPSVKVLYLAGIPDSLRTTKDFGITSLNDPERYGLTLVLGGGEVSPLELTSAYSVFANDGTKNNYREILKIEDMVNGKTIFEPEINSVEVLDKNIARIISDVLSDNKARAPSFGEFSALYFPGKKVAAKTGTTNDYRDAWVIGYTPSIAIGAWAGNNNNTPMKKKVAGFIVAPWWHEVMEYALTRFPEEEFLSPDPLPQPKPVIRGEWRGGKEYSIDTVSGKLATEYTPKESQEKKVVQQIHSILYWLDKNNPLVDMAPLNPSDDPQFKNWEFSVRNWAISNNFSDQNEGAIPKDYDNIHIPGQLPVIKEIKLLPVLNSYKKDDIIFVVPAMESKYEITQLDYFLNDEYIGSIKKPPFQFGIKVSNDTLDGSLIATLKIKIYDTVHNTTEKAVSIPIREL